MYRYHSWMSAVRLFLHPVNYPSSMDVLLLSLKSHSFKCNSESTGANILPLLGVGLIYKMTSRAQQSCVFLDATNYHLILTSVFAKGEKTL